MSVVDRGGGRAVTWPTEQAREAVREALASEVTVGFRDEAGDDAYQWGVMDSDDRSSLADTVLAALAPHVAALVRAERAAAVGDAADWLATSPTARPHHVDGLRLLAALELNPAEDLDRASDALEDLGLADRALPAPPTEPMQQNPDGTWTPEEAGR